MGAGSAALLGVAAAARETGAYSSITGDRTSSVDASADGQAIVGLVNQGPVKRNTREPMVEITNNGPASVTYTVTLDTCSEGTLYNNVGDSGCSVSFTLASGNSRIVDIDASVTGTITYSISGSGTDLSFSTTGSVQAESGAVASAVTVEKPTKDSAFTAVPPQGNQGNVFEVKSVDIRDGDGDNDIVEAHYEVIESGGSGDTVGEKTVTFAATGRYSPNGNPAETIQPNSGYTIQSGMTYQLVTTGTDADGNFDSSSVQDTA